MSQEYYIYIMTNQYNTVLYTGMTNNLKKRVYEHKEKLNEGFTKKYNINKLVYYEIFDDAYTAISREKQIRFFGTCYAKNSYKIAQMPCWA